MAIILCCLIVGTLTFSSGRNRERDSYRAAEYQEYGERREAAFCADLSGALLAKCQIEQEQATRQAYQAERDLDAQRDMALWAFAVFIIGAITAGLTLWALWYVRGTLVETRGMTGEARDATKEMAKTNTIARAQLAAQFKPSLLITATDFSAVHFPRGNEPEISPPIRMFEDGEKDERQISFLANISIKAIGPHIPTIRRTLLTTEGIEPTSRTIHSHFWPLTEGEAALITWRGLDKPSAMVNPAGWAIMTRETREAWMQSKPIIWGIVDYEDPIGNLRRRGFAFQVPSLWHRGDLPPAPDDPRNYDKIIKEIEHAP